jgi:hypothetical protein
MSHDVTAFMLSENSIELHSPTEESVAFASRIFLQRTHFVRSCSPILKAASTRALNASVVEINKTGECYAFFWLIRILEDLIMINLMNYLFLYQ